MTAAVSSAVSPAVPSAPQAVKPTRAPARLRTVVRGASWHPMILVVLLLVAWEMAVRWQRLEAMLFPAPSAIARELVSMMRSGLLGTHVGATVGRLLSGLALGGGTGLLVGLVLGTRASVRRVVEPFVSGLHPVPKIALFPLLIVLLGIGEAAVSAVVALATFFPMVINATAGVQAVLPEHRQLAWNYRASRALTVRRIVLPAAAPFLFAGLRIALNVAFQTAVSVEIVATKTGLGALLWLSWQSFRVPQLFATLTVIVLMGAALGALVRGLQRQTAPWLRLEERAT